MTVARPFVQDFLPGRVAPASATPWIPMNAEKSWKPLRFFADGRGFVELLRMSPGALMPLHRHTGEIHAYNLTGTRTLCTGEVIGPGDYVYEPPGNADWWKVTGDEEMIALVVVMGEVEFIDAAGAVRSRASAATQLQAYRDHCQRLGLPVLDLVD
ncbi:cupin domain-containing protein [Lysobacter panacisoli]|uniref:ChrR-like cupin domain-containing protein n=1 Tax=Lysobacter panacisoli TaxID=1255263 RepID=A0ABP9L367_9GAMM|nr:cupin domain-containing protein [Lysobacter panacisoli]